MSEDEDLAPAPVAACVAALLVAGGCALVAAAALPFAGDPAWDDAAVGVLANACGGVMAMPAAAGARWMRRWPATRARDALGAAAVVVATAALTVVGWVGMIHASFLTDGPDTQRRALDWALDQLASAPPVVAVAALAISLPFGAAAVARVRGWRLRAQIVGCLAITALGTFPVLLLVKRPLQQVTRNGYSDLANALGFLLLAFLLPLLLAGAERVERALMRRLRGA